MCPFALQCCGADCIILALSHRDHGQGRQMHKHPDDEHSSSSLINIRFVGFQFRSMVVTDISHSPELLFTSALQQK